jgi:Purine nucleoside permease (NUP)
MWRALDLSTGSAFSMPPKGTSAANLLKSQATGEYAAYAETYLVGSPVVRELAQHWSLYQDTVPTAKPKAESDPLEFSSTGASGVQWFLTASKTQPIPVCGIPYRYRSALRAQIAFAVPPLKA